MKRPRRSLEDRWFMLRMRLNLNVEHLIRDGVLCSRVLPSEKTAWSIRYRERDEKGKEHHRSIYVGTDEDIVIRTRDYLRELGRPAHFERQLNRLMPILRGFSSQPFL